MKNKEISKIKNNEELLKKISSLSVQLYDIKVKNKFGQISNPLEIRTVRREIARLKTTLTLNKNSKV